MLSWKARAEALGRTEAEIRSEMASALGRIGRTLSSMIADLHQLQQMPVPGSEMERVQQQKAYKELRSRAKLYYWYLTVQREAIGIRNHDSLREQYSIPADI